MPFEIHEAIVAGQLEGLPSSHARGLKLDATKALLYKITVNNRDLVPVGIPEKKREATRVLDQRHADAAIAAGKPELAVADRVRPDRKDTGGAIYQNIDRVGIGSIRSLLALKGYVITNVHYFPQRDKFVIVLSLAVGGTPIMLAPETIEGLRKLARENSWTANFWDNDSTQTFNFTRRAAGALPQVVTLFRNGYVMLVDAEGESATTIETREDLRNAAEISQLANQLLELTRR
jgi:hypothetical protein